MLPRTKCNTVEYGSMQNKLSLFLMVWNANKLRSRRETANRLYIIASRLWAVSKIELNRSNHCPLMLQENSLTPRAEQINVLFYRLDPREERPLYSTNVRSSIHQPLKRPESQVKFAPHEQFLRVVFHARSTIIRRLMFQSVPAFA